MSENVGGVKGNTLHGHIIRGLDEDDFDKLFYAGLSEYGAVCAALDGYAGGGREAGWFVGSLQRRRADACVFDVNLYAQPYCARFSLPILLIKTVVPDGNKDRLNKAILTLIICSSFIFT